MDEYFKDKSLNIDELTKVYRRDVILGYIEELISKNIPFDVCILDVDNFKYVNDGYGHLVGDRALIAIANKIKEILGDEGYVGRYGGDEFIIVAPYKTDYDDIWELWHSMLMCSSNLNDKELDALGMTVTMGSSRFPKDSTSIDGLFELADKALYRGKMKGRNCFIIYIKEKHEGINLKTQRDKIVSSSYIYSLIFNKVNQDDLKTGVKDILNYIGNYFMIDHLCLSTNDGLYCNYYHPLCKKKSFKQLDDSIMRIGLNTHTGIFYKNCLDDNANSNIASELLNQGVYSVFWIEVKAHNKSYGYVRADICDNARGRIWQNLDIDILTNFCHLLALELYYRNIDIKELES